MDFSFKAIPTAPNPAQLDLNMDANPANAVPVNAGFDIAGDEYSVRPMNADWNALSGPSYILNKPNPYVLPIASATVLGGIKIGSGLSIDVNGVLSNAAVVAQPNTQIVYGTGTGISSSVGLKYDPAANMLTTTGQMTFAVNTSGHEIYFTNGGSIATGAGSLNLVAAIGSSVTLGDSTYNGVVSVAGSNVDIAPAGGSTLLTVGYRNAAYVVGITGTAYISNGLMVGTTAFSGTEKLRVNGDTRMDGNLTMVGSSVGNTTNSASFIASKIDWTITPNGFGQIFYGLQINAPTVNNSAQSPIYYGLYVNTTAMINKLFTQGNGFNLYDNTFALVSNGRVNIGASSYGGGTTGMLQINISGTSGVAPFAVNNDITMLASIGRDGSAYFNGIGVGNAQGVAGSGHWIGYDASYPNDIVITPQSKNLRLLEHGVNYPERRLLIGNVVDDAATKVQIEGGVLVNGDINITGHYKVAAGGGFINLYVDSGTTKNPQFLFGTTVAGGNSQWSIQGDGTTLYGALDIYAVTSTGANIASTNKAFNVRTGNTHILSLYGNGNAGLPTANASFAIGSTTTADFGTLLVYNSGNTKIGFPGASAVTNAGLTVATRDDTSNKEYMLNAGNDSTGSWLQSRWTSGFAGTNYSNFFLNPNGGSVVVGATVLIASEKLRVNGDIYIDKSIRIGSQTLDPTSPANGLIYYNSTSNAFKGYINGAWAPLLSGAGLTSGTIPYWGGSALVNSGLVQIDDGNGNKLIQFPTNSTAVSSGPAVGSMYFDAGVSKIRQRTSDGWGYIVLESVQCGGALYLWNTNTIQAPSNGWLWYYTTDNTIKVGRGGVTHSLQTFALQASTTVSTSTYSPDFSKGNVVPITLSASVTLSFSGIVIGEEYTLRITQDATGGRTVTWPGAMKWPGGTAPVLTTTAGKTDIVKIWHDGVSYWATFWLNY